MQEAADYIPVEEVAVMLDISHRQAARYKDRVRTMKAGSRILFHREDILEVARRKGREAEAKRTAEEYAAHRPPKPEVVTVTVLVEYLRERDALIERLHQQLQQASHRIGELETELRHARDRPLS